MTTDLDTRGGMTLEDVTFAVAGTVILQPLTCELSGHGMTALIGQNGSGKSTLLRILARQQPATRGRVTLGGRPLEAWPDRAFARHVAYLPQHTPLAPGITVRELVSFGRYPWHGALGRFGPSDGAKVDDALSLTGTDAFVDRFVDTLSGGERQRVWLAMLIAQDARLLLLDEPISALDVAHQLEVLGLIRRLCQDRGIAVVVVVHDINMAARYCDRLVALKQGRLVADGPPATLMAAAQLGAIFDVEMGVLSHPDTGAPLAYVRGPHEQPAPEP
jgi:ferric hydroxamate transport system ATP-binding protein